MTASHMIFLKQEHHPDVPAGIQSEEICHETIIVDGRHISGQVIYLQGPKEALQEYFRQTGPVWTSANPMVGLWTLQTMNPV